MANPLTKYRQTVAPADLVGALKGCSLHPDELGGHPEAVSTFLYVIGTDALAIEQLSCGSCYLHIQGSEYFGTLDALEEILCQWAIDELYPL